MTIHQPKPKILHAISDGLEEIEAYFGMSGAALDGSEEQLSDATSGVESDRPEATENEDSEEDYYGEDDGYDSSYFDREEIEVAIDAFLSELLTRQLIKKKMGKLPVFSDVFNKFFGPEHEITGKAQNFEEFIKGYFGWISPEDMRAARNEFRQIQEILQKLIRGDVDAEPVVPPPVGC